MDDVDAIKAAFAAGWRAACEHHGMPTDWQGEGDAYQRALDLCFSGW